MSAADPAGDTVAIGYVHGTEVAYSWHHSILALLAHDMVAGQHVVRGSWIGVRYGTGGIVEARNKVIEQFLAGDDEWLFWIDTDMGFAPDTVERLLEVAHAEERPVVGALCFAQREVEADGYGGFRTRPIPTVFGWGRTPDGREGFSPIWDYPRDSVIEVAGTGSACILVHRSAFAKVADRGWYDPMVNPSTGQRISEDLSFCARVRSAGMPILVHTGVRTTHLKPVWVGEDVYLGHAEVTPAPEWSPCSSMAVLVPSRGRPGNIDRLAGIWKRTAHVAELVVLVDNDDPELAAYEAVAARHGFRLEVGAPSRIAPLLDQHAPVLAGVYDVVGFMGDDHLPRTAGWDVRVLEASTPFTVVYGNDLLQGENLPTQVFLGSGLVRAWGRMTPPGTQHLYLDNAWKLLGEKLGTLTYLPDVVIEHLHFLAGKAEQDAGYAEVNSSSMYTADRTAFAAWIDTGAAAADLERIRAAMADALVGAAA